MKFLLDDSRECLSAMRFAAMRAEKTGVSVKILSVIEPEEFQHWIGVGDLMRAEARERIEVHYEVFAKWMRERHNLEPELEIREGETVHEILGAIKEDPQIGLLVLGAGTERDGPGPLVAHLSRTAGSLPVPITIVPGSLTKDEMDKIT
jgi:nucleotide-binding universal stress UspA family protein